MPPTGYRANPSKTSRSMCPHAMSRYVWHSSSVAGSWWEQCLPGTKDLLPADQGSRSWLFHRDVFLHPPWNKACHISSCNTTQLFLPSGYVRGKYSTNNFFTVRIFTLRRITELPLLWWTCSLLALSSVAQWVGSHSTNGKAANSIPG